MPHLPEIDLDRIVGSLRQVMPNPRCIPVSGRTGTGIAEWIAWLREQASLVVPREAELTHPHPHGHVRA